MVSCEDDSCPWSVRAICCKGDNVWKIAKSKGPHTCDKIQNAHDGRMIDSAFLAYVLERYIREDPAYKIKNLRHVVLADLKHEVSHYKVWDAKQKAVAAIYGDFKESYAELPHFLAGLTDASPGTQYKLIVDDNYERGTCTFNSVFWAFRPCIVGFKQCRPVISIDATHLYGKYKGKLMIAMATDANNKIYPLAFAVVESESTETWGWFLACIRTYVTDRRHLCVISDRHPGIQAIFRDSNRVVSLRPPMTEHRYCLRHLCSNVNTRWKNETLKNLVWRAASATQERKFNATFDSIENVNGDAHRYLKDVPKEKWALTFDNGYCHDPNPISGFVIMTGMLIPSLNLILTRTNLI
ncbi:uncharacterized protein LOC112010734 [Quercus suber]|uniref:uncharacterized protein LOC112010734 n=1 Tax=Quercus suber TaxID=58331 RepID=UPI0032DEEB2A